MDLTELEKQISVKRQYCASMLMSLTSFCYGCAIGWLSPMLPILRSKESPLGSPLENSDEALLASLLCLGAIAGTPVIGMIADKFGRKTAGLYTAIPFVICWILKLTATTLSPMYVARALAGAGGTGAMFLAPLYATEVASPRCRGVLASIAVMALNAGILFAFVVGAYTDYYNFLWILLIIPVGFFITFLWMPETPIYLVKRGKNKEAAKSIAWLCGVSEFSPIVQETLRHVQKDHTVANIENRTSGIRKILFYSVSLKALALCILLVTIQGMVGMYAIMSYASVIFQEAGGSFSANISSMILASQQLAGSFGSIYLIERWGRKLLLGLASLVVSVGMAALGTYFYLKDQHYDVTPYGWVPVTALSLAVMFFSVGVGPVPIIIISEVFMIQVRSIMITCVVIWMWLTSFFVSQCYGMVVEALGTYGTYWGFSIIAITILLTTVFFVPETKGKRLPEILGFFSKDFEVTEEMQEEKIELR